jgi:hypothetical protein
MKTKCPHKRFGEWAEACFVPRALEQGLSVSRPTGDSDGFDFIVADRGEPLDGLNFRVAIISSRYHNRRAKLKTTQASESQQGDERARNKATRLSIHAQASSGSRVERAQRSSVILSGARDPEHACSTNAASISQPTNGRGTASSRAVKTPNRTSASAAEVLADDRQPTAADTPPKTEDHSPTVKYGRKKSPTLNGLLTRPLAPKPYRIQVRATRTLEDGMYSVNFTRYRYRRYSPVDADFIAAFVSPEDAWYIIPVSAAGFVMSIRLAPHRPSRAKYEKYREAWHLLRS